MRIYENNKEVRFFTGIVRGFAVAMIIHAIDNFGQDKDMVKKLGEEEFNNLYQYDWKGNNIRPEAIFTCKRIINEFLNTCISYKQKQSIEDMDDDDKINFGYCLYLALFRHPLALDDEYQQAVKEFPETDVTPGVEIGDDGKAGIVFA